ncbi:TolC family protein [Sulfurimonas sp.]
MRIVLIFIVSYMTLFGLTLQESIELAINNSPKIAISKSNIKYNEYLKDESMGAYHPTLQAGFDWQKLKHKTSFTFTPTHNYSLSLKYNLFNGFSDYANVSSKDSELESAKLENDSVVADLKLEVISVYTDYLKAQKNIKTQEEQLTSLTKQYENTKVRYEQGIIAKNDLLLIEVDKLKAEQALTKANSNLLVTKSNLENIIAMSISSNDIIEDFDVSVEKINDLSSLESQMMKNRSEIKAMVFKNKSLLSQKDALTGNYLPKVNLEASHQINDQERTSGALTLQPKDQTTYGVNVTWDLYSGFRNRSMQKALLEQSHQQNYLLHQLKLDLKSQLVQVYENLKVAKSAKNVAARAKESATENYRITSDRYDYGKVDTLTLLVSQSNLTLAINENNNAYYDLYLAYKILQRVVGK